MGIIDTFIGHVYVCIHVNCDSGYIHVTIVWVEGGVIRL
jgi:hypothetical protein